MDQNDERMLIVNNNFEKITKDIDLIKNEINNINKNKAKNDLKEIQININNGNDNNQQIKTINNENIYYLEYYKKDNKKSVRIKRKTTSDISSSIDFEQKNDSEIIIKEFITMLEEIFFSNLNISLIYLSYKLLFINFLLYLNY